MKLNRWAVLGLVAIVVVGGVWIVRARAKKSAPKYRTAVVERGDVTASVSATGTVKPVVQVEVGSQVSGTLEKLNADYNSRVRAGQVLCTLEPSAFRARLAQAEAAVARAEAALKDANRQLARSRELVKGDYISQADVEAAEVAVDQRRADLKQAQAGLQSAQVDLDHATIRAPIDGVVISRSIDVGQTVAASLQAPKLFVIANDLRQMQVETRIDEADIGRIRPGLPVEFSVDAFPDEAFEGKVSQVRLEPITDQNVVTYTTVIATRNDDLRLRPGMTANVTVSVESKQGVLKVPNAALRFRPAGAGAARGGAGGNGSGGASGGMGGMRRSIVWVLDRIAPAALAQEPARTGPGGARSTDPFVQDIRDKVRRGELTREQAREIVRKHFEEQRKGEQQGGAATGAMGPGSAQAPAGGKAGSASTAPAKAGKASREVRDASGSTPTPSAPGGEPWAKGLTGGRNWGGHGGAGGIPGYKPGTVYVLKDGKPARIGVLTGISDGVMTEVMSRELKEGDTVVVGMEVEQAKGTALQPPPGMGGPQFRGPGGGRR